MCTMGRSESLRGAYFYQRAGAVSGAAARAQFQVHVAGGGSPACRRSKLRSCGVFVLLGTPSRWPKRAYGLMV